MRIKVFFVWCSLIVTLLPLHAFAGSDHYNDMKIESRAKRGYTNHGTVIYNYHEIRHYNDNLSNRTLGNLDVKKKHVRKIYDRTYIQGPVKSSKGKLDIGAISVTGRRGSVSVDNTVTVRGGVKARGKEIKLGTVETSRSNLKEIKNRVNVRGSVSLHEEK